MSIDIDDDVPPFAELKPLAALAREMGATVATLHRWRLDPSCPLAAWLVGRHWHSTTAAVRDFIRRRTAAAKSRGDGPPAPAPVYSARRRRQIDAAMREAERLGC